MSDIEYLYKTYWSRDYKFSDVTSSYWTEYGAKQKISYKKTSKKFKYNLNQKKKSFQPDSVQIQIEEGSFGDFRKLNIRNLIFSTPITLYLLFMLWPKLKFGTFYKTMIYTFKAKQCFRHDITRMALTSDFLSKNIENFNIKSITIIGDGYGRLGCVLKSQFPNLQINYINLGRNLLLDLYYSNKVFPEFSHSLIKNNSQFSPDFNYIEAEKFKDFDIASDVFINIASMQEMNPRQIEDYFNLIKIQNKGTYFYCCNRLTKTLPDGTIINFEEYPWGSFKTLIDEICPWYQKYPSSRFPFVRNFDGPIQHRLVQIHEVYKL